MSIVCRKGKSTPKASKWRFSCFSKFGRILDRHFFYYEFVFWKFDYMRRKLILRPKFRVCIYLIEKSIVFFYMNIFLRKTGFFDFWGGLVRFQIEISKFQGHIQNQHKIPSRLIPYLQIFEIIFSKMTLLPPTQKSYIARSKEQVQIYGGYQFVALGDENTMYEFNQNRQSGF